MDFENFMKPELFILIPVLYFIGIVLKKSKIPDNLIPTLLGGISIVLSAIWVVSTSDVCTFRDFADVMFVSVTQGILSAGASVYFNQIYIQTKKKD